MAPVAPKTVTFTRRLPLWLLWWWRGGRRGRCHRRAGRWTPRFISYYTDRSPTTGGGPGLANVPITLRLPVWRACPGCARLRAHGALRLLARARRSVGWEP